MSTTVPLPVERYVFTDEDRRFAADWAWIFDQLRDGALEPYADQCVGVYQKQIVVVGDSETKIREEFAKRTGHSGDLLVAYWVAGDDIR